VLQMKNHVCNKLAACLRMKPPPHQLVKLPRHYVKTEHVVIGDNCSNIHVAHNDSTASVPTTEINSVKELLKEIRDLLKTRTHNEEARSYEADKEDEMKKDWMLAAAVLDRICAIAFTIGFAIVTLIFVILFSTYP